MEENLRKVVYNPIAQFMEKSIRVIMGIILVGISIALTISLATYDKCDPSLNTVVDGPVQNYLGYFGSTLSDLLIQLFGASIIALPIAIGYYGIKNILYKKDKKPKNKISFYFLLGKVLLIFSNLLMGSFLLYSMQYKSHGALGKIAFEWLQVFMKQYIYPLRLCKEQYYNLWQLGIVIGLYALTFIRIFSLKKSSLYKAIVVIFKVVIVSVIKKLFFPRRGFKNVYEDFEQAEIILNINEKSVPVEDQEVKSDASKQNKPALEFSEEEKKPTGIYSKIKTTMFQEPKETTNRTHKNKLNQVYQLPPLDLLQKPLNKSTHIDQEALQRRARDLESVLAEFGVKGEIVHIRPGPVVTLYALKPAPGIKSARIIGLADDIARSMSALSARVAAIPGQNVIGIELPNDVREMVYLREIFNSKLYDSAHNQLTVALGKDIGGEVMVADIAKLPHLLVAGTTGSGKSVSVNAMIVSLLYRMPPDQCKFIMIDPKMLELSVYDGIPHLLAPVVTDPKRAVLALKWVVKEMENRYRAMSKLGVRNIEGYNNKVKEAESAGDPLIKMVQTGFDPQTGKPIYEEQSLAGNPFPFIVVIVDEMADLMLVAGKDIEAAVQRLAQMARAAGIHLIMATQRPSVNVITGTIKANIPAYISFQVPSKIDSRVILGEQGAEQLLGQGDMLYKAPGGKITRIHAPFVSDLEVENLVNFLKSQGEPEYVTGITEEPDSGEDEESYADDSSGGRDDSLYRQAVNLIIKENKASTSFIQRHLRIGYNTAARLVDRMEQEGIVSAANHVGRREILKRDINAA